MSLQTGRTWPRQAAFARGEPVARTLLTALELPDERPRAVHDVAELGGYQVLTF